MERVNVRVRGARAVAIVCAAAGLAVTAVATRARSDTALGATAAPTAAATTKAIAPTTREAMATRAVAEPELPAWIDAESFAGKAFVYPPQRSAGAGAGAGAGVDAPDARPVTVLLHGMCGEPRGACGPFVDVSTARGWLVCPSAEDPCGGGTRWRLHGADDAHLVDASVGAVARAHPGEVDPAASRVLVGFSLGGIAAVRIAQASAGEYAGLVVIASQVHPDAATLERAGVRRVVLAAGDLDMTSAPLQADARRLAAAGLPTRFVSLGHFGHGYPADMQERMREPMTWVAGGS